MTQQELANFISTVITYDTTGGEICPNCKFVIVAPIYTTATPETLTSQICVYLNLKGEAVQVAVTRIILTTIVSGDKAKDSENLAGQIWLEIYG